MHRFQTSSSISRLRLCAIVYLLAYTLLAASLVSLPVFMFLQMREWVRYSLVGLAVTIIFIVWLWILSSKTYCPLCRMPVLGKKSCNRHRNSKSLLTSHRLPVSLSVLIHRNFRCPYCNEPSELKVRERKLPVETSGD